MAIGDDSATPCAVLARLRRSADPDALGALFGVTALALFRGAQGLVGDVALAEGVLQEAFLAVIGAAARHTTRSAWRCHG